jgi:predicted O-linked N-acetylglucosamine transferase (SPINDLY family)
MSSLLEEAILLHKKGQLKEAEKLYKLILKSSVNNFEATHLLGIIKIQSKQFEEAIKWINRAIVINKNDHSVFNNLGVCYKELKKYPEALNSFKTAIKIKPDYAEAYNNLAIIYKALENYEEAIKNYYKAIKLKPDYAEAYNNLAIIYKALENYEEAIKNYYKVIKLKPDYAEAYNNLGVAYLNQEKFDEAKEAINKAIKLKPDYAEAYNDLGKIYRNEKNYEYSIKYFFLASNLKKNYFEAYNNLGITYLDWEKFDEAKEAINKAIKLKPDYAEAYNNLGVAYLNQEKFDEAEEAINKAIKLKPDYAEAYNNLGSINFKINDFDTQSIQADNEALININEAIRLKPSYAEAYNNLGLLYFKLKEYKKAKSYIFKALKLDANHAKFYSSLAMYYEFMEDFEKAETNLKKALEYSTRKIAPTRCLANFYYLIKNFTEAEKLYNLILQEKSDDADTYFCRGVLYDHIGKYEHAIKDIRKAIEINPKIKQKQNEMFILISLQNKICDWQNYNDLTNQILTDLKKNKIKDSSSFTLMNFSDSPELIKKTADCKRELLLDEKKIYNIISKNKKIHVGYYSPDFKDHPVGYIVSELFDYHNKEMFEITGFSLDPSLNKKIEITDKIINSVDTFLDCSNKSYTDIINESRKRKIDIAIDLAGFTQDNKIKIFANRAAPIQLNFLGYPCTLGLNHDYIIGDLEVIPKESVNFYFEKIIYMPHSYLPSFTKFNLNLKNEIDSKLKKFSFKFGNLNSHGKITPIIFNSWINILEKVENSALILNEGYNKYTEENLIKEAIKRNLNPERIIFSKRTDYNKHNMKFSDIDLFLDTFPYNGHSTASTCLQSGVPLLTIRGRYFQSRVASSLLKSLKMDELISLNVEEYENKAINIGNSNKELQRIKNKLHNSLANSKVFNSKIYTENLEKAFNEIYEKYHKKQKPENIFIQ